MTQDTYFPLTMLIDGEWINGDGREMSPVLNPADGSEIGRLPHATADDLERALQAAERGFREWRNVSAYERAKVLQRAADLIRERREDIASRMTLEQGKVIAEARLETDAAADFFEWYAGEGRRAYGRTIPPRVVGAHHLVFQEPIGPVAAFSPWNFPAVAPARKIAAALAAGCSCIIKPAEETPATALALARALQDAGLPAGVLNVVFGTPSVISETLLRSDIIRKVSFTGSTTVGRHIAHLAADGLKKASMELGGHGPVIVFKDADPEVVALSVAAKIRNAGQVCVSPTRFIVEEDIYDSFKKSFADVLGSIRVGNGMDPDTRMGPVANARRVTGIEELIADAEARGGRVAAGGSRLGNQGYFLKPTLLVDLPSDARALDEEPFGPLATLAPFRGFDAAIAEANRLRYGLAAYAFTRSNRTAMDVSAAIESGMVGINSFAISMAETPFGGVKDSGYGSEGGVEGLEAYMTTKFVAMH